MLSKTQLLRWRKKQNLKEDYKQVLAGKHLAGHKSHFKRASYEKDQRQGFFFAPAMLQAFTEKINTLTPQSQREWGALTPDQMLHHLNLATGTALGYFDLSDESYLMSRTVSKWLSIDFLSEQPKGLLLPLTFKIPPTQHFDFEYGKKLLIEIINKA